MNEIPTTIFVALGAIIAALIAGSFSLLNLIISKDQKVSEFRQEWIDAFRQELSDLTAAVFHMKWYLATHEFEKSTTGEAKYMTVAASLRESHETYVKTCTSMLLRINPSEKDQKKAGMNTQFLLSFSELREAFNDNNLSKASELCGTLREKAAPILKTEWERVKRGERVFRMSKWIALTVLLVGSMSAILVVYNSIDLSDSNTSPNSDEPVNEPSL